MSAQKPIIMNSKAFWLVPQPKYDLLNGVTRVSLEAEKMPFSNRGWRKPTLKKNGTENGHIRHNKGLVNVVRKNFRSSIFDRRCRPFVDEI